MSSYRLAFAVTALALGDSALAVEAETLAARSAFADALARIERGVAAGPVTLPQLEYPLFPYLTAAGLLRAEPGPETDRATREFLALHRGEPVAFPVHRAWLASLAEQASWRLLVDHYSQDVASLETECAYLQARVELGETNGLADLIAARWLTPRRLPASCEPAFQWLRDIGGLGTALTEARVRLLLEEGEPGFARVIAGRLPAPQAQRYVWWAEARRDPLAALDEVIESDGDRTDHEALLDIWSAAARDHPRLMADRFDRLRQRLDLTPEATSLFARALALALAWDRQPDTLRHYGRVAERDLDDYALAWLVRAALWSLEWGAAEHAIATMSPAQRDLAMWRFWRARSLEALAEHTAARELYRSVIGQDNYYAAIAAARLQVPVMPSVTTPARDGAALAALESRPAVVRARELFALGRRIEATREWRYALRFLSPAEKEQAVILAHDWGWHDVAVATATETGAFNHYELLYPLAFGVEIADAARATGIADDVLFGLVRQESLFREDVVSPAGAVGLTQLLPATARRTAREWAQERLDPTALLVPGVNLRLGAATLRTLLDRYDGQLAVALAAYNAGPAAADRWLPGAAGRPTDVWIENIPFNETRDYVQRVIWHSLVYGWRRSGAPQDAAAWLGTVSGADAVPPLR